MEELKKIMNALEAESDKLRELIQKREDKVNDASEKWQESEKGEFYISETEVIEMTSDDLVDVIDALRSIVEP